MPSTHPCSAVVQVVSSLPRQRHHAAALHPFDMRTLAGLLPLHCGTSGLMVIIFIMVSAFVVTFYTMLAHEPCTTGLGKCRTISCICGNVYEEGYVFMFSTLSLTSLILVQRFSSMFHRRLYRHKVLKAALIVGSLLLTLTGIFPERCAHPEPNPEQDLDFNPAASHPAASHPAPSHPQVQCER